MSRTPIVAGNWKMHGAMDGVATLAAEIGQAVSGIKGVSTCICPTFVHLHAVNHALRGTSVSLGAQDVCEQPGDGAFTGEVNARMLVETGCAYVIVGHSERRHIYGESDYRVAEKFAAACKAGLTPILCVGETLEERRDDRMETVLQRQLSAVVELYGIESFQKAVIAYEPVWAIGTGESATPEQAQAAHAFLRAKIAEKDGIIAADLPVLYGGSVKPDNAAEIFAQPDVDGGLIGGASLDAGKFEAICRAGAQTG
jgi:triosephosphate isomerase